MDTAQAAPNTVILAQDEASLYLQATVQLVWHRRGQTPVVKLDPGRKSVHFYGALDLRSGQETAMMSPIMNGATTALFLHKSEFTLKFIALQSKFSWSQSRFT